MLRGFVLSIVLVLAVGQEATVLCALRCQADRIAATECHEEVQRSRATVVATGADSCWELSVANAILKDDLRSVSRQDTAVPHYQTTDSPGNGRQRADDGHASPFDSRPLVVVLRV
jgi:hypothetical protein